MLRVDNELAWDKDQNGLSRCQFLRRTYLNHVSKADQ